MRENLLENKNKQISDKLFNYIEDNFSLNDYGACSRIIYDVIKWTICEQQMSEEKTIDALEFMLYGLGIDREEIEKFVRN